MVLLEGWILVGSILKNKNMTRTLETTLDRDGLEIPVMVEYCFIPASRPGRDEYGRPTEPPDEGGVEIQNVLADLYFHTVALSTARIENDRLEQLCLEDAEGGE
jgi:hypothetical protein